MLQTFCEVPWGLFKTELRVRLSLSNKYLKAHSVWVWWDMCSAGFSAGFICASTFLWELYVSWWDNLYYYCHSSFPSTVLCWGRVAPMLTGPQLFCEHKDEETSMRHTYSLQCAFVRFLERVPVLNLWSIVWITAFMAFKLATGSQFQGAGLVAENV